MFGISSADSGELLLCSDDLSRRCLTIVDRQSKIVNLNYREAAGDPMKYFFFSILLILGLTSWVLAQQEIVPAASTALYELVLEYNDVLDTCTQTSCSSDERDGRWSGLEKTECGIHHLFPNDGEQS